MALLVAGFLLTLEFPGTQQDEAPTSEELSPFHFLAASADVDFARPPTPWAFQYPADHGRHDEYRTEWWYVAGTVGGESRAPLGVQLLLMRMGLRAQPAEHPSAWAMSEIYAGIISVSDPDDEGLRTGKRLSRGAAGLAGTNVEPIEIWVEDWRLGEIDVDEDAVNLTMHVATSEFELDLELLNEQPLIDTSDIYGRNAEPSSPFQFYIQPRLSASGMLRSDGRATTLSGTFSMEHAWGELPLPGGPIASDRFTLHLDDQRELFCVRMHRADGTGSATTTGLLVSRTDPPVVLSSGDIGLDPLEYWTSPRTGARYPIRWMLRVPEHDVEMELIPYWEDQEGLEWMPFWAGPVRLQRAAGTKVGDGFMQLYGYEDS